MTLQTDGQTGRGYHNIPTFSSKRAGINISKYSHFAYSTLLLFFLWPSSNKQNVKAFNPIVPDK